MDRTACLHTLQPLLYLSRNKESDWICTPGDESLHRNALSSSKFIRLVNLKQGHLLEKKETLRGYVITYAMP